jgi:hypothetical protein
MYTTYPESRAECVHIVKNMGFYKHAIYLSFCKMRSTPLQNAAISALFTKKSPLQIKSKEGKFTLF